MTEVNQYKLMRTVAALGIIMAIVCAILYFMALPIFDEHGLAWLFFYGLIAAALGVTALVVRTIWDTRP